MTDVKKKVEEQQRKSGNTGTNTANAAGGGSDQQFQAEFNDTKVSSDAARVALGALKELTAGIESENLKQLNKRLDSLNSIEQYVRAEKVSKEEEEVLFPLIKKVRSLILNYITQKKASLSKAANSISKSSINLGNALILMSKNDPLMKMAVAGGGLLSKKIKEYRKKASATNQNQKFLDDMNKAAADIDQTTQNSGGPIDPDSLNQDTSTNQQTKSKGKGKGRKKKGTSENTPQEGAEEQQQNPELEALQQIQVSLANLDNNVLEIAQDSSELLQLARLNEARQKNAEMDNLEAQSESKTAGFTRAPSGEATKEEKSGGGLFSGFTMPIGGLFKGLGGAATLGIGSLVTGLLWAVVDGIKGIFKSDEWGVSKLSAFLGGFFGGTADDMITNVLGNMGKWALMGAGIGSVFPVVGTLLGGLIGAAVGAILGFFGGEKVAKFFESLGGILSVAFDAVIDWGTKLYDWVGSAISEMWAFMSDAVGPALDIVKESMTWLADKLSFILDPLKETITQVVDWFTNITKKFWDWLDSITPEWAKGAVSTAKDLGSQAADAVSNTASSAWEATKGAASSAASAVSSFFGPETDQATVTSVTPSPGLSQAPSSAPGQSAPSQSSASSSAPTKAGPEPKIAQAPGADTMKKHILASLNEAGITDKNAQANILSQVDRESKYTPQTEILKYSPKRLMKVFPKYFKNEEQAKAAIARGPEYLGNIVYGGRMGNAQNEGYKYRGRGLIQLTGKDNYAHYGKMIGEDLVSNPELANDPKIASKLAVAYFKDKQKHGTDLSNINQVNQAVGFSDPSGEEKAARKKLAAQYAQQLNAGDIQAAPAANQANKDIVATKSAPPPVQQVVYNNTSNKVNNVKGGGGSPPPQPQGTNGTSARRMSYSAAIGK